MWFLLLQIFILMLLAAALGGALMWWWLSRKHEAIADSRERLLAQTNRIDSLVTRDDMAKQAASILNLINGQKVDLQPVEQGISRVNQAVADIRIPQTDLAPVHDRIRALEAKLADVGASVARMETAQRDLKMPEVDLGPVHAGIASLGLSVSALEPKFGDVAGRLESGRRNDMDILAARFTALSNTLSALRMPDLAPAMQRLSEVQAAVANIRMPDVAPVQQRLAEVHAAVANIPPPNLQPLQASLADLEAFVVALDRPPQDFSPLFNRMSAVDTALAGLQSEVREATALRPVERRLASLEEALGSMPGPDFAPVLNAVRSIDNRNDLVAVENRLTALEYGLAALHHMMRSRPDAARETVETRVAPPLQVVRQAEAPPAPVRPERDADPINAFLRAGDQANLLTEPAFGVPDDLERIDGVGPMLRALLHDIGVYYFWQVAEWTNAEIDWVESKLAHFRGRIRRDDWVGQARTMAAAPGAVKRPGQSALRKPL